MGDLIVPEHVLNLDNGEISHPVPLGAQVPRGTLASSDVLIEAPEKAERLAQQGVVAIDMETAAIAAVCERRGIPWSVFRAVSDRADDGTTDAAIFDLADSSGDPKLASVARFVVNRPHRIPQLLRLARGGRRAAGVAARATLAALHSIPTATPR